MTLNEYQNWTDKTAIYPEKIADFMLKTLGIDPAVALDNPKSIQILELVYTSLGLAGEAGEVANKVKKLLRGDFELTDDFCAMIADELGDTQWYVAQAARSINKLLEDLAQANIVKLQLRVRTGTLQGSGDKRQEEV